MSIIFFQLIDKDNNSKNFLSKSVCWKIIQLFFYRGSPRLIYLQSFAYYYYKGLSKYIYIYINLYINIYI
jgi:hypothetical protein